MSRLNPVARASIPRFRTAGKPIVFRPVMYGSAPIPLGLALLTEAANRCVDKDYHSAYTQISRLSARGVRAAFHNFEGCMLATFITASSAARLRFLESIGKFIARRRSAIGLESLYTSALQSNWGLLSPRDAAIHLSVWETFVKRGKYSASNETFVYSSRDSSFTLWRPGELSRISTGGGVTSLLGGWQDAATMGSLTELNTPGFGSRFGFGDDFGVAAFGQGRFSPSQLGGFGPNVPIGPFSKGPEKEESGLQELGSGAKTLGAALVGVGGALWVGAAGVTAATEGMGAPLGSVMVSGGTEMMALGAALIVVGSLVSSVGAEGSSDGDTPDSGVPDSGTATAPEGGTTDGSVSVPSFTVPDVPTTDTSPSQPNPDNCFPVYDDRFPNDPESYPDEDPGGVGGGVGPKSDSQGSYPDEDPGGVGGGVGPRSDYYLGSYPDEDAGGVGGGVGPRSVGMRFISTYGAFGKGTSALIIQTGGSTYRVLR